jgi:hypothetical protein
VDGAPPYKGEHAGQRADYFRARSVPYLLLTRTGLRITPLPDAMCKPLEANLAALWYVRGRRKTEATVEALLGSLDHKCTLVHLALGERVCLGYRGGRLPSRESGTGGRSP